MEDFIWEDELEEVDTAAECIEKEYYTKAEVDNMINQLNQQFYEELKKLYGNDRKLDYKINELNKRINNLQATFEEVSDVMNKYLNPEKEKRKLAAQERLKQWAANNPEEDDDVEGEE